MMSTRLFQAKSRNGFTLVELAVVVVIIGVLAAFGVPRLLRAVERTKAAEALNYLQAIRASQERYLTRESTYTSVIADLDVTFSALKYFTAGAMTGAADTWSLTLTRITPAGGYGPYTVVFTQDGFNATSSTILPEINPMGSPSGAAGS